LKQRNIRFFEDGRPKKKNNKKNGWMSSDKDQLVVQKLWEREIVAGSFGASKFSSLLPAEITICTEQKF